MRMVKTPNLLLFVLAGCGCVRCTCCSPYLFKRVEGTRYMDEDKLRLNPKQGLLIIE